MQQRSELHIEGLFAAEERKKKKRERKGGKKANGR